MKVKDLKELLEQTLFQLEDYEDEDEVKMVSNTYFLNGAYHFIGIAGYNGGYISLDDIEIIKEDEEEDDEE